MSYLQPWQLHELLNAIICSGLVVWELLSRRSFWKVSRAAAKLVSGTSKWQFTDCALLCAPTTPNTKVTLLSCLLSIWLKISLSTCTTVSFILLPVQRRCPNMNLGRQHYIKSGISSLILQLVPVGQYQTTLQPLWLPEESNSVTFNHILNRGKESQSSWISPQKNETNPFHSE